MVAIVAAGRACDHDPIDIVTNRRIPFARWYAFAALIAACPDVHSAKVARWCGFSGERAENAKSVFEHDVKIVKWWREDILHEVKRALYAEIARAGRAADPVLVPNGTKRYIPIAERLAKVARAEADKAAARPLPSVATGALDLNYRPDAPAHKRDVEILTAEICGDPAPERSALWARQHNTGNNETATEEAADEI